MWKKIREHVDGHETGRWQWGWVHPDGPPGYVTELYPGRWMFSDTFSPPPGVGEAPKPKKRGDDVNKWLAPIEVPEEEDED